MISKTTKGQLGYLQQDGTGEDTTILPWACFISFGPGNDQVWDLDGRVEERYNCMHLCSRPATMSMLSQTQEVSFPGTPCSPCLGYIYIKHPQSQKETMLDCLEVWICILGLLLRLFDTLVIASFQSLFQPWISLDLDLVCPQTLLCGQGLCLWLHPGKRQGTVSSGAYRLMLPFNQAKFWLPAGTSLKRRKRKQWQELLQRGAGNTCWSEVTWGDSVWEGHQTVPLW